MCILKRTCILLAVIFLHGLGACALAEGGVNIEVIRVDGASVIVLTPEETMLLAQSVAMNALGDDPDKKADIVLPQALTLIEESAFEGNAAEIVEVTGNVVAIEAKAFANCKKLKEIAIPATVLKIDDHAFDGCEGVTVYGRKGSEAERIAELYGFTFVDPNAQPQHPDPHSGKEKEPVELPAVKR